ncbi:MAG: 4Fe-4S binding protein, partial [Burkholderiaceae bacterium]|nr:4Fe-4S binding protein [Burkholderiaceae bacterium]
MSELKTAWFNGKPIQFEEGKTILEVARANKIFIPTLCAYMPLDHKPGTCRMCLVHVTDAGQKEGRIVTACTTPLREGQKILTRTERVRRMQRLQMELIFADHDQDCKSCLRHGDCELQDVALFVGMHHGISAVDCPNDRPYDDSSIGLVRDVSKCIRCGRCVEVCRQVQGIGALTIDNFGVQSGVALTGAKQWADSTKCIECGQCTLVCPTGALTEKDQTDEALLAIDNPKITTVVQFAPAVRVTLGEEFGLEPGVNVEKRIVSALRTMGVDYVMDTNFAADMVIMEEGTELLQRLQKRAAGEDVCLPMFTSCCPGWINYVEQHEPRIMDYLSTTKSPQAVFGAMAKKFLPEKLGIARENLRVISIMPCTAKKGEAARPNLTQDGTPDVDMVLTVRELARLIRRGGLHLRDCEESEFDTDLFTTGS